MLPSGGGLGRQAVERAGGEKAERRGSEGHQETRALSIRSQGSRGELSFRGCSVPATQKCPIRLRINSPLGYTCYFGINEGIDTIKRLAARVGAVRIAFKECAVYYYDYLLS